MAVHGRRRLVAVEQRRADEVGEVQGESSQHPDAAPEGEIRDGGAGARGQEEEEGILSAPLEHVHRLDTYVLLSTWGNVDVFVSHNLFLSVGCWLS